MALAYTTDQLITEVRNRGVLGDTESAGTEDADIIKFLNSEMYNEMVPRLMRAREEYLVVRKTVAISSFNNTNRYRIDPRAIGGKLREIQHIDSDNDRMNLARIDPSQIHFFNENDASNSRPSGFVLQGAYAILLPETASWSGSLEVSFYFRPGQLVLESETRTVSSIAGKVVTVDSNVPAGWTTSVKYDVHSSYSGAEIKVWSAAATTVSGADITFTADIDGSVSGTQQVEVGDRVCLENEAAIPGLPFEMHPMLAHAAACRIMEAQGDIENLQASTAELNRMGQLANQMIDNRVEGQPQKIVNRGALLWKGRGYRRSW